MDSQLKNYISCFDTFFKYLIADNIINTNQSTKEKSKNETLNTLYFLLQTNLKNTQFNITMSKVKVERKECIHVLTSGPRKNQYCSKKTTLFPDTNIVSDYCTTHIGKSPECNFNKSSLSDTDSKREPKINQQSPSERRDENQIDDDSIVIRKNKFNNFVFGKTGLIIKSSKEKYIVARESDNGDWLPLTDEDIDECKRYHLKYKIIDFNFKGEKTNQEYIKSTKIGNISQDNHDDNFIDIDDNFDDI